MVAGSVDVMFQRVGRVVEGRLLEKATTDPPPTLKLVDVLSSVAYLAPPLAWFTFAIPRTLLLTFNTPRSVKITSLARIL